MDHWISSILQWLLTQGWPGVVVVILLAFGAVLFKDMREELRRCRERISELQDKRVKDAQDNTSMCLEAIEANRSAVTALTDILRDRRRME